jgi:hypothetical protein
MARKWLKKRRVFSLVLLDVRLLLYRPICRIVRYFVARNLGMQVGQYMFGRLILRWRFARLRVRLFQLERKDLFLRQLNNMQRLYARKGLLQALSSYVPYVNFNMSYVQVL